MAYLLACLWFTRNAHVAILSELARQATASKGMHVGKLLASWRRKISLAVHDAHADNVLGGLPTAADGMENALLLGWDAFSGHGVLHPRRGPQAPPCFLARCA
jgi:hypothetical protein